MNIIAVLSDASEAGTYGASPLGWRTLNGTKSNATDFHSITAKTLGITRDRAKCTCLAYTQHCLYFITSLLFLSALNYKRMYGGGWALIMHSLKQLNPTTSGGVVANLQSQALLSRGQKPYLLRGDYVSKFNQLVYTKKNAQELCARYGKRLDEMFTQGEWSGGTLSAAHNYLERNVRMQQPKTPFLECRMSRAIEMQQNVEDQVSPLRMNWVIQSGAVDFLHLMLVCMRWLMSENIRFCISYHDEVRYLVREEMAYKAAVALHMTNLLTRSFCAMR